MENEGKRRVQRLLVNEVVNDGKRILRKAIKILTNSPKRQVNACRPGRIVYSPPLMGVVNGK